MKRRPGVALALALLAAALAPAALAGDELQTVPVTRVDGVPYVSGSDVAHLLGATRFWRSDLRRWSARAGSHQVQAVVDNPFVLVDDRTVRLDAPVRSLRGEVQLPVALLDSLPRDSTIARLVYDPRRETVTLVPAGGVVRPPLVTSGGDLERWTFPLERCDEVSVVGRARNHFRVRFSGYFAGRLPDTLREAGAARSVRALDVASGSGFEFALAPDVAGYRLSLERDRAVLEFARAPRAGLEPFAPEGPRGPRDVRVVVLDPGHGGEDAGVAAGGLVEKDLALSLARALKPELERRLRARVVLTREGDVEVPPERRAEEANRVRADLVISLHFDAAPAARARGVTAWCAAATWARDNGASGAGRPPFEILEWRDAGLRHAVPSRALADDVLAAIEFRGLGPTRLRERLPFTLLGVNAPGLLLECATLTSAADRERLAAPRALSDLAAAIAAGVETWQRNE